MSSIDTVHWGGRDRIANLEDQVKQIQTGGSLASAASDVTISSDTSAGGTGDVVISTHGVERTRITNAGLWKSRAPSLGGIQASYTDNTGTNTWLTLAQGRIKFYDQRGGVSSPEFHIYGTYVDSTTNVAEWIAPGIDVGGGFSGVGQRDLALVSKVNFPLVTNVYDFLYVPHRDNLNPTLLIGNSSIDPGGGLVQIISPDTGAGAAREAALPNLRIRTASSGQTGYPFVITTWTSATDRFTFAVDGSATWYDAGGAAQATIAATSGIASFRGTSFNIGDSAYGSTSHSLFIKTTSANSDIALQTTSGGSFQIQCLNASGTVNLWSTNNSVLIFGTNSTQALKLTTTQSVLLGKTAPATTATDGFPYMPAVAGTPTGVPTTQAGFVAYQYDTTNNKFWVYNGAWKGVVLA